MGEEKKNPEENKSSEDKPNPEKPRAPEMVTYRDGFMPKKPQR